MLTVCLLIGWNYWAPLFLWSTPFALYGGNSQDFHTFYLAGKSWLSHGNPYNVNGGPTAFIYPPTSLPIFGLFGLVDFRLASQLWLVTYFSLFVVALVALGLTLKSDRRNVYVSIAVLLFLTSYPLFIMFQLGQSDLLVASFVILSLVCERLKHRLTSAVMLSVATLLKGPAVLLLIYFVLFRKDFGYLARFLASTLLVVAVSLFIVPIQLYWYYAVNVLPTFSTSFALDSNQSITGLVSLAKLTQITPVVSVAGFVLFGIFAYRISSRKWVVDSPALYGDGMFLMNFLVILLFGPRSTVYPYVVVILPLALFLSGLLMERVRSAYLAAAGVGTFLLNSTISPDFLNYRTIPLGLIGNVLMTIALILLYVRPNSVFQRIRKV
jgi:hypothetical protein